MTLNSWGTKSWLLALAMLCQSRLAATQRPTVVGGAHYGVPLKWSAVAGIGAHLTRERTGFLAGEVGLGGWRGSAGFAQMSNDLGTGLSVRASLLRTTRRAWKAPSDESFGGVEVQFFPLFALGARVGVFMPLRDSARRGLLTVDVGWGL